MSDTPRTDEMATMQRTVSEWVNRSTQLERELAETLEQRDALVDALKVFADFPLDKIMDHQQVIYGFDHWKMTKADIATARKSLAAVKGSPK